jgi:oligosaccharyltransferase complex subunit beta
LAPKALLSAQASYLNTLYVLSPSLSAAQSALLREYDIEPSHGTLYDAFSHVGGGDESDVVLPASSLVAPEAIVGSKQSVVYGKGTGFTTGQNPFLVDIVAAPTTAYLGDKDAKSLAAAKPGHVVRLAGDKVALVAALQTRENVRIGFVGSVEMFNDKWWGKKLDG